MTQYGPGKLWNGHKLKEMGLVSDEMMAKFALLNAYPVYIIFAEGPRWYVWLGVSPDSDNYVPGCGSRYMGEIDSRSFSTLDKAFAALVTYRSNERTRR